MLGEGKEGRSRNSLRTNCLTTNPALDQARGSILRRVRFRFGSVVSGSDRPTVWSAARPSRKGKLRKTAASLPQQSGAGIGRPGLVCIRHQSCGQLAHTGRHYTSSGWPCQAIWARKLPRRCTREAGGTVTRSTRDPALPVLCGRGMRGARTINSESRPFRDESSLHTRALDVLMPLGGG
jgi:hypothetical protein